jgi:hypothetical protein
MNMYGGVDVYILLCLTSELAEMDVDHKESIGMLISFN